LCLLREHGQLRKDAKAAIHGRSARAVPGAGRFAPLTVFPVLWVYALLSGFMSSVLWVCELLPDFMSSVLWVCELLPDFMSSVLWVCELLPDFMSSVL